MKVSNYIVCVSALLVLAAPPTLWAEEGDSRVSLMVSRDADGSINKESSKAIKELSKRARKSGHIRVWVTLNTRFDPFLVDGSEQRARVDDVFDEVLDPLLSNGDVQYDNGERVYRGPSLLLIVTDVGLSRLVDDLRVGQLVGVPE